MVLLLMKQRMKVGMVRLMIRGMRPPSTAQMKKMEYKLDKGRA
jgi:hypothetical protein